MYRKTTVEDPQMRFEFAMPFGGKMDINNRWVHKRKMFPWAYIEELYEATLSGSDKGCAAISAGVAFGAIYIQEFFGITDRETVAQIQENPYQQYFIGYRAYSSKEPFDHSLLVTFRKRFSKEIMVKINARIVADALGLKSEEAATDDDDDAAGKAAGSAACPPSEEDGTPHDSSTCTAQAGPQAGDEPSDDTRTFDEKAADNHGRLLVDATCTPADVPYPTDVRLLNESREKSEQIIDLLHAPHKGILDKPRTYRRRAHKEYVAFSKQRRPGAKKIRKAIRVQLGYLGRNLATIKEMAETREPGLKPLSKRYCELLPVINEVYRQQQYMYENNVHKVDHRIVNIYQPHVRPIVRGKAGTPVEFGAKVSISLVDGYSFVDRLSWEAYNESGDLIEQIERYKKRYGCYPASVHADKIYRTRANRDYCQSKGIRLGGTKLGRPPQETAANKDYLTMQQQQRQQDERDRQAVEGKFGQGKRRFRLDHIMTKLAVTSEATIMMAFIVMNIEKIFRDLLFVLFSSWRGLAMGVWNVLERLESGEKYWPNRSGGLHLHSQQARCAA